MNSFVTLLCFAAVLALTQSAATPDLKEKFVAVSNKCKNDVKVTSEQANIFFSKSLPKDDVEKCFLECMYKTSGIVKDGKINVEECKKLAAIRFQDKEELDKINAVIDTCAAEVAENKGEKCSLGSAVRACSIKHAQEIQFFDEV